MNSYGELLDSLPIENRDLWYFTWKFRVILFAAILAILFPYVTLFITTDEYITSLSLKYYSFWAILLLYYLLLLYPYFKERKLEGWKPDNHTNTIVYLSYFISAEFMALGVMIIHRASGMNYLGLEILLYFTGVSLIIFGFYALHLRIRGYTIEKSVKRIYDIPDLRREVIRRLESKFPDVQVRRGMVEMGQLKIKITNSHYSSTAGTVRIMGITKSNADKVRKIMKLVDVLG